MNKAMRIFLFFVSIVQLLAALAFFLQWAPVTGLWPFPGTTPLTFIFISSIFAAAGAATLWAVASDNLGALAGIGLDYLTILVPVALLSFQIGITNGSNPIILYGVTCVIGALFGLGLFLWSVRMPMDKRYPCRDRCAGHSYFSLSRCSL